MKKVLIILVVLILLVVAAAFTVPILFKDEIKAQIDTGLTESLNAEVVWDTEDFGLTLFSNFPNVTATLNNFGVLNKAPFEGQILFAVEKFEVEVDLLSLFGAQMKVNGIVLNHPEIFIKIKEDGTANYDIAIDSGDERVDTNATSETSDFDLKIDHWKINNGHLIYDDLSTKTRMELKNLNHQGSGNFNSSQFDLTTHTICDTVRLEYEADKYLYNKSVEIDAIVAISDEFLRYTFKENKLRVNDFVFHLDGFMKLNGDESIDMDLRYASEDTSIKGLLSLVPGFYTSDFEQVETKGELIFNGGLKGTYDSINLPSFDLNVKVDQGMFKYPDLPESIDNIAFDFSIRNESGVIDETSIKVKDIHFDLGKNPIDGNVLVENLTDYSMKVDLHGKLDLGDLTNMFPIEGTQLKGLYVLDFTSEGIYDSITGRTPIVNATMRMEKGYVKSDEFPFAMEDLHFQSSLVNETGKFDGFRLQVQDLVMVMDGKPFKANMTLEDMSNYKWVVDAEGTIDLDKMVKVFPIENTVISGVVNADIHSKGSMEALDNENYDQLPTSGVVSLSDFSYQSNDLAYDVKIKSATAKFDPKKIYITDYQGSVGRSDMTAKGSISNYMEYLFKDNQTLKGRLTYSGQLLDINEFMEEEESETLVEPQNDEEYGVIPIPDNLDFVIASNVNEVQMMDMTMSNASGDIIVRNGMADLSGLNFDFLGGKVSVDGVYDTRKVDEPRYDFKMNFKDVSISEAFNTFEMVRKFVPVAKNVSGNASTDFALSGLLDGEMSPVLSSVSAEGLVEIAKAAVSGSNIVNKISKFTKFQGSDNLTMKDVIMNVEIKDGKLHVKPFDVNMSGYQTTVEGSTALDGAISYTLKTNVPANKLGASGFSSLISQYSGSEMVPVTIGLGGSYEKPVPKLLMSEQKSQIQEVVKNEVKDVAKDAAKDALNEVAGEEAKKVIGSVLGTDEKDTTTTTKSEQEDAADKLKDAAKEKIKNLFKKKKKN